MQVTVPLVGNAGRNPQATVQPLPQFVTSHPELGQVTLQLPEEAQSTLQLSVVLHSTLQSPVPEQSTSTASPLLCTSQTGESLQSTPQKSASLQATSQSPVPEHSTSQPAPPQMQSSPTQASTSPMMSSSSSPGVVVVGRGQIEIEGVLARFDDAGADEQKEQIPHDGLLQTPTRGPAADVAAGLRYRLPVQTPRREQARPSGEQLVFTQKARPCVAGRRRGEARLRTVCLGRGDDAFERPLEIDEPAVLVIDRREPAPGRLRHGRVAPDAPSPMRFPGTGP